MTEAIIYHKADLDGIGSAAIVLQKYPDAELYPADYGDENYIIADFKDKDVFIVDFCPENIEKIKIVAKSLCWIDHHKTAREKHIELWNDKKISGTRSLDFSAIALTWNHFNITKSMPTAVAYIEDYDMWRFKYNEWTKAFGEYAPLVLQDPNDAEWDKLLEGNEKLVFKYIANGNILLKAKNNRIERIFKNVISINIWGYKVGFVNTPNDISNIGNYIATNGFDIGAIWRVDENRKVIIGLRSVGEIDVSKIAEQFVGGGGHKNASGFTIDLNTFIKDILCREE